MMKTASAIAEKQEKKGEKTVFIHAVTCRSSMLPKYSRGRCSDYFFLRAQLCKYLPKLVHFETF
jgi:hypothetical protein